MKRNRIGPNSLITVIENDEGTRQARVEDFDPSGRLTFFEKRPGEVAWQKVRKGDVPVTFWAETVQAAENLAAIWAEEALLPPSS